MTRIEPTASNEATVAAATKIISAKCIAPAWIPCVVARSGSNAAMRSSLNSRPTKRKASRHIAASVVTWRGIAASVAPWNRPARVGGASYQISVSS